LRRSRQWSIAPRLRRASSPAAPAAGSVRRRFPNATWPGQREVVDAFFAAAHDGDFDRLVAVLDPEVVLRSDRGKQRPGSSVVIRGARAVAARALTFARLSAYRKPALVNGAAGVVVVSGGRPFSVMGFTVVGSRIVEIDILSDPERLRPLDLSVLND